MPYVTIKDPDQIEVIAKIQKYCGNTDIHVFFNLTLCHSELPILHRVLAILSAKGLNSCVWILFLLFFFLHFLKCELGCMTTSP